jgi:ATP-dependent Clp protease ATP-binding subunit ClpC
MTSNVGAETIKKGPNLGFAFQRDEAVEEREAYSEMHKTLTEQLKRTFRPEFINRVDSIIVFRQLTPEDIRAIVDIILAEVNERLREHEFMIQATDAAKGWLVDHGYDREFGARPLRRLIQSAIEDQLSDAVLGGRFGAGDVILVDVEEDELILTEGDPSLFGTREEGQVEEPLPAV